MPVHVGNMLVLMDVCNGINTGKYSVIYHSMTRSHVMKVCMVEGYTNTLYTYE